MRFFTLIIGIIFSFGVMAQGQLTPQAHMKLARAKAAMAKNNSSYKAPAQKSQTMKMVVKVAASNAADTYSQIRAAGATVLGKIGRQAVIEVPVDAVEAISQLSGVKRIDVTHKGRLKTDVTMEETGVTLIDGTSESTATAYTGKGVTIGLIDCGIDFQHPAFKDSEGRSRIKCVYMMGENGGHKMTINDPETGTYTFPGSVYDTPELIATLTTDNTDETHGTHTAGIAAGSRSPLGFGGMAPEADIVLIPLNQIAVEGFDEPDANAYVELALAFASAYAQQSSQPMVLSCSMNSHSGPHDGTSSITEAIEDLSDHLIPIFSAGNEGGYPIHLYNKFTATKPTIRTLLMGLMEDATGEHLYMSSADVTGYTRSGDEASVKLTLKSVNQFTGRLTTVWTSEECRITKGGEPQMFRASSEDDNELSKYFTGEVNIGAFDNGDGRLCVGAGVEGYIDKLYLFELAIGGSANTEIDLWDEVAGFGGVNQMGMSGYVDGNSDMSAGDWTCTDKVVSVGAYCANVMKRDYDGSVTDTSVSSEDEEPNILHDIAWFSSYGTSFNDITQPTICAPGVNVVSSLNSYNIDSGVSSAMQWEGYPYGAESGTSMACPVVSGIVALWLQAEPTMKLAEIKDVMNNSSTKDSYTATSSHRWGYGKINAAKGIEYISSMTGINNIPYSNTDNDITYDLQGRKVNGTLQHGVYIRNGRKVVVR